MSGSQPNYDCYDYLERLRIIVPILMGIIAWILSYWFEDTRLGNPEYIGLIMLIATIPVGLIGLAMNAPGEDENGQPTPKGNHSFFFIPVMYWGLILLAGGIYFYWIAG